MSRFGWPPPKGSAFSPLSDDDDEAASRLRGAIGALWSAAEWAPDAWDQIERTLEERWPGTRERFRFQISASMDVDVIPLSAVEKLGRVAAATCKHHPDPRTVSEPIKLANGTWAIDVLCAKCGARGSFPMPRSEDVSWP